MNVTAFQQANQLLREGKLEAAVVVYRQAITQNPQFYGAYQNLGETLGKLGRLDQAVEMYRKAIELKPEASWLQKELGLLLQKFGGNEETKVYSLPKTVNSKPEIDGSNSIPLPGVFLTEKLQDNYLIQTRQSDNNFYELAQNFEKEEKFNEAVTYYQKAIQIDPKNPNFYQPLADLFQKMGRIDEAINTYNHIITLKPDSNLYVYKQLGNLLLGVSKDERLNYSTSQKDEHHSTANQKEQEDNHIKNYSEVKISFGIKTNRKNEFKTIALIFSILSQNINSENFEILITGDTDFNYIPETIFKSYKITLIKDLESANNARLATMLNTIVREAKYDYVCSCDDDIIFTDGWYKKLCIFLKNNPSAKIISFPIKNTDGSRFWDWAYNDSQSGSQLANLGEKSNQVYVTGGMVVLHKQVWQEVKWDESRGFYQKEDVDWSERARKAGYTIEFCTHASVLHNDWRYFQSGTKVIKSKKLEEILEDIPLAFKSGSSASVHLNNYISIEEKGKWPIAPERILGLKNKYKNQRCFIVGNGPSLNLHDLLLLESEITFGVNGIFYKTDEMGFKPTFYVVEDKAVMRDNVDKINQYNGVIKIFPTDYYDFIDDKDSVIWFKMNQGYYEGKSPNFRIPRFSTDSSERVFCGQTVTFINLQLAYFMGFSEVYLIGMDFSYQVPQTTIINGGVYLSTGDDPNHFHPQYFGSGKTWHDPKLDRVERAYKLARLVYESSNIKLYNATFGGKLEVFERVDYNAVFGVRTLSHENYDNFNEDMYLTLYPDVRNLIERDDSYTAIKHYEKHGKYEGRIFPKKVNC
jgi:Tfp pilus assembly protein PilF